MLEIRSTVYVVWKQEVVGVHRYDAEIIGAYKTARKARKVAREGAYRHVTPVVLG